MDTPSLQIAQEHKGTLIRCRAEGDPVPKISWYFNGVSLNGNNNSSTHSNHPRSPRSPLATFLCFSCSDQPTLQRNRSWPVAAERVLE